MATGLIAVGLASFVVWCAHHDHGDALSGRRRK